jgi:hypothetical protein
VVVAVVAAVVILRVIVVVAVVVVGQVQYMNKSGPRKLFRKMFWFVIL